MILKLNVVTLGAIVIAIILLPGCRASGNHRAPIEERGGAANQAPIASNKGSGQREADVRPQFYVIQKGDTLYSIAFEHGLDYREVAEQNNIENPAAIQIGQKIKLIPADEVPSERPRIETKPLAPINPIITRKDQPKIGKLQYSEKAVAQIENMQQDTVPAVAAVVPPILVVKPPQEFDTVSDEGMEWSLPTKGRVISEYSENANRKGVDIAGDKGQAVWASAAGKVVYSGSGLRGYGKLVIIKHNKTYLSAYAHNEQILVKEGQSVTRGQKIAEMGSTDADQIKLHFEIRKFGKPVDPAKFLNLAKS